MHWETKKLVCIGLLRYLLYCSGLEQNRQYLRVLPLIGSGYSGQVMEEGASMGLLMFLT